MPIDFTLPVEVVQQTKLAQMAAVQVMRRLSRYYDEHEHERPMEYIQFIWPFMQQMERSALPRTPRANGNGNGNGSAAKGEDKAKKPSVKNIQMIHMIEALSWGDAGIYLCTPSSALGGAAINAVGTPEQKERFMRRFTEGTPKWGAMAMTEPQAGSDTSNIQTTARLDDATHEWVLNGEKIFCTSGALATEESNGLVVVWATIDRASGRAGMKPFVVESGTPGMMVAKKEHKLGIRASDTVSLVFDNCRIPYDNILGSAEVTQATSEGNGHAAKGFKGAMKTFDASRPWVAASAMGIARAAFESTRDLLAKEGVRVTYDAPLHSLTAVQRDLLEMEAQLKAGWLLTVRSAALMDAGESNSLEAAMAKAKAGQVVTWVTQKAVELLGPMGYSREHLVEKWMRDAKINDIFEGTGQINTLIVARRILGYTRRELK
jgi:acyl-CoA dehydrogenase